MKKTVLSLIVLLLCPSALLLQAQETPSPSPFLFDDYKEGIVYLKSRTQVKGKLNLYLPTGEFLFIDGTDGNKVKVLSSPEEVSFIRFGSRVFLTSEDGGVEVLSSEPPFHVLYRAGLRDKGKTAGFGGTSTLGRIKTYSANSSGTAFTSDPLKLEVSRPYNIYRIGKKLKEVKTMKQFLKLYSKHKEALQQYIDENRIRFDNALEMLRLTKYAESLE